jgi:hypothetical protein
MVPTQPLTPARLRKSGLGAFFRPRDIEPLGISFPDLQRLVAEGAVEKVGRGLYRLAAAEPDELETIAMVASAVPTGIVCLLSALRLHNIGTQAPHEVWLALDRKARKPSRPPARLRIVRFSGAMLTYGVQDRSVLGVRIRLTSPARTVVDCFRYRHKIGLDGRWKRYGRPCACAQRAWTRSCAPPRSAAPARSCAPTWRRSRHDEAPDYEPCSVGAATGCSSAAARRARTFSSCSSVTLPNGFSTAWDSPRTALDSFSRAPCCSRCGADRCTGRPGTSISPATGAAMPMM